MFNEGRYYTLKEDITKILQQKGFSYATREVDGFFVLPKLAGNAIGVYYLPARYDTKPYGTLCDISNVWLDQYASALWSSKVSATYAVVERVLPQPPNGWPWIFVR